MSGIRQLIKDILMGLLYNHVRLCKMIQYHKVRRLVFMQYYPIHFHLQICHHISIVCTLEYNYQPFESHKKRDKEHRPEYILYWAPDRKSDLHHIALVIQFAHLRMLHRTKMA